MKIPPVEAQMTHADGQTHRLTDRKLIIPFRNFENAPKSEYTYTFVRRTTKKCGVSVYVYKEVG